MVFPLWEHNIWDNEYLLQPQRLMTIRPATQSSLKVAGKRWSTTRPYLLGQQAQFQSWNKNKQCSQVYLQTEHMHNHLYCCSIIKCTTYCSLISLLLQTNTHLVWKSNSVPISSASTPKCTAAHHSEREISSDTFPSEITKSDNIKITPWQSF